MEISTPRSRRPSSSALAPGNSRIWIPSASRTVSSFTREDDEGVADADDRVLHLRRVKAAVGPVHTPAAGVDIMDLRHVLDFVEAHAQ
jgi:hypothetical protein